MTGTKNGIATHIKKWNKNFLLAQCYSHTPNFTDRDTIKNIPLLKDTLDKAYEITKLLKKSPKRSRIPQKTSRIYGTIGTWFPCI